MLRRRRRSLSCCFSLRVLIYLRLLFGRIVLRWLSFFVCFSRHQESLEEHHRKCVEPEVECRQKGTRFTSRCVCADFGARSLEIVSSTIQLSKCTPKSLKFHLCLLLSSCRASSVANTIFLLLALLTRLDLVLLVHIDLVVDHSKSKLVSCSTSTFKVDRKLLHLILCFSLHRFDRENHCHPSLFILFRFFFLCPRLVQMLSNRKLVVAGAIATGALAGIWYTCKRSSSSW